MLILNCPLISVLNRTIQFKSSADTIIEATIRTPPAVIREMQLTSALLVTAIPLTTSILAFHASNLAGDAVRTNTSMEEAIGIWNDSNNP